MNDAGKRDFATVGKNEIKIDALSMCCGRARYTDDCVMANMLYAKLLTSPHAHALIESIDTSAAEAIPGVVMVLTHKNVPRVMHTTAGQGYPEPSPYDFTMFDNKVRHVGDRVAVVAAETEDTAEEALRAIKVTYKILPAVFDPEAALLEGAPIIHDEPDAYQPIPVTYEPKKNLVAQVVEVNLGDVERGLQESDSVFEHTYEVHQASHCMLEAPIVVAYLDENNRLTIRTSTQVPFHVRRIVAQALQIPVRRVRVIKPRIGGGFGGKQEILCEDLAGMLCLKTGRPVRLQLSRREVFIASRTRHAMRIHLRTGMTKNGTMHAIEMDALMNNGGYGSHGLTVLSNTGSKSLPMFNKVPHVRFVGRTAYTNLPVGGAYRGYGATQSAFALGQQIDMMARTAGIDVPDFYLKNVIQQGETSPIFKLLGEGREGVDMTIDSCGLKQCIEVGCEKFGWRAKRSSQRRIGERVCGAGMVCLMQGSSIPEIDMGSATIKINDDGSFNLIIGATDLGTGSDTVLAQIAAEVLGVKLQNIIVYSSDTDLTPFDVGAYASSTTYLSGMAVYKAAVSARDQIIKVAAAMLNLPPEGLTVKEGQVIAPSGKTVTLAEVASFSLYQRDQFQIIGTGSHTSFKSPPPFSAHFAEVAVDPRTGQVEVLDYVATVDCGTAINPILSEGQTEGAIANGISYALCEEYIYSPEGRMLNPNWGDYKIYNAVDMPPIRTFLIPTYEPSGPFGAKSVSEIGINGPLPAIANAIYDAVGIRLYRSPFTAERVLKELRALPVQG